MDLTYVQNNGYEIICDPKGYVIGCYISTTTNIYGDKVYIAETTKQEYISLDKMKNIIQELKEI
jgi:hypothetical protein